MWCPLAVFQLCPCARLCQQTVQAGQPYRLALATLPCYSPPGTSPLLLVVPRNRSQGAHPALAIVGSPLTTAVWLGRHHGAQGTPGLRGCPAGRPCCYPFGVSRASPTAAPRSVLLSIGINSAHRLHRSCALLRTPGTHRLGPTRTAISPPGRQARPRGLGPGRALFSGALRRHPASPRRRCHAAPAGGPGA